MKKFILLLFFFSSILADQKSQVLEKLFQNSTKHIFNVAQENFLLKMAYKNNQLHYRTVYPFGTINVSGFYRLSTKITNKITIAVSDVSLDLNGNVVEGGIEINSGLSNIAIKNGTVAAGSATDAIKVNSACSNITISDVTARNATAGGICFDTVTDSMISNCDFTQNSTGLSLQTCANISVQNCT